MNETARLEAGAVSRVSLRQKLAYGMGAVTDMIGYHGPVTLVNPIFNIVLGVSPTMIGLAKGICRVWDAFTDPVMGTISDRGLRQYGRRRPFIIGGALAMGLTFFGLFSVPRGMGDWGNFVFMTALLLLFYSAFTVFTVPYHAMGYELAADTNDRTRVMAWRLVFNMVGNILVGWLFAATQLPVFRDTLEGVFYVGGATGLVIIVCGIVPGLLVPERTRAVSQQAVRIGGALKAVWRNRPFVKLVALALLQIGSGTVAVMIGEYVNFYHVYGGNLAPAAFVSSTGMTVGYSLALASAFLWTRLSTRYEKRTVLLVAIAAFAVVNASTWWLFTPEHPYLQILYRALNMPIVFGFWLMVQSMIADTCEYEEWNSGSRRDGIMGACVTWSQKMGVSAAFVFGGLVLDLSGFQAKLQGAQPAESLLAMRIAMVAFPVAGMLAAAWVARSYPLDRAAMKRFGAELKMRRATAEGKP
jgi:glycoside/pentoside/hexuronide:cation symporter, GPH family